MSNTTISANTVTEVPAGPPAEAIAHFQRLLTLETDCYDVHQALTRKDPGFVLFDVRGPEGYAAGHVPQAVNFPYRRMTARRRSPSIRPTRSLWCTARVRTATAPTRLHSVSLSSDDG